jgi:hypothetical protein
LCASAFTASEAIARGEDPWRVESLSAERRRAVRKAERKARNDPLVREFITVKALKKIQSEPSTIAQDLGSKG